MNVVAWSIATFCAFAPLAASGQPLPTSSPAPADVCLGIQGDAEYLKRQVEDSIKKVRDDLFFQREEDASALALQDRCKGRKDASPQCQVIAADLEARTALRKQNEPKVQASTATLQYYRTEYDQANLDLYRCQDMVETEKQLKAASDPDKPPVDPNQPTPPSDTDQQNKQTANAGTPPDPNQPDAPAKPAPGPKPIDDPGSRTADPYRPTPTPPDPNTLERERNRVYQPPVVAVLPPYDPGPDLRPPNNIGEPYARGPRGRDRKIGSRLGVPGASSVGPPLTGSDGGPDAPPAPPDEYAALITDTCDWAAQQTDPVALSARERKLQEIQADTIKKKADAESLVTSLRDKLNAQIAKLDLDKATKRAPEVTDAQQRQVDLARTGAGSAQHDLDRIKGDNFRQRLLPVAISCIVSRKASLAKQAKAAPPAVNSASPKPCDAATAQYQCIYMGAGAGVPLSMGSASGVASMVMSVCVPPSGFASASCAVDTITPGSAASNSVSSRTTCDPPKDELTFMQQCKDLHGRLVTPTQQVAKAPLQDVAPSSEGAVASPEKEKQEEPSSEGAVASPEKPKPPAQQSKAAQPDPVPAPPPSTSAAASAPHVNVLTLPDPPELGPPEFAPTPNINVVTLPPPPELGPPQMTPGPHVKGGAPTPPPAPASAQPYVNIYEKPAHPTPPALKPPPGGSSGMNWGNCETSKTGPCAPSASTEPKSGPAAKAAPKPLPPEKLAAAMPKIEPAKPAQKAQPKVLPPQKVAAVMPKIEPAAPAQKAQPKALPPEKSAATAPHVEPAPPSQKPEPKAPPPAPPPAQANNAPVQPGAPAEPAVKPHCSRVDVTFHVLEGSRHSLQQSSVGGAPCHHDYFARTGNITLTGISFASQPRSGSLKRLGTLKYDYQPNPGFKGTDTYAVRVCGQGNGRSGCSTLTYQMRME